MGTTVVWIKAESSFLIDKGCGMDSNRVMGRAVFLNSKRGRPASQDSRVAVVTNSVNLADGEVTEEAEVDQTNYLMRAVSLARGEACLLTGAFLCLVLSSGSSLILPNYQGRILDHVIQRAVDLFRRDVLLLVVFSFMTGLLEAGRNLCFAVVGKRVLKTLQDKLFMGIIIQDIAYFDGTTSGEVGVLPSD